MRPKQQGNAPLPICSPTQLVPLFFPLMTPKFLTTFLLTVKSPTFPPYVKTLPSPESPTFPYPSLTLAPTRNFVTVCCGFSPCFPCFLQIYGNKPAPLDERGCCRQRIAALRQQDTETSLFRSLRCALISFFFPCNQPHASFSFCH